MTCPRCGLNIPVASLERCPQCGHPLYSPLSQDPRVTKLVPSADPAQPTSSLQQEVWPDLTSPSLTQPDPGKAAPPLQDPVSPRLPPRRSRRLLGIAMAAAVILLVVSGGVLWLVAGGAHRQTAHLPATVHTGTPSKATATSTRIAGPSTSTSAPIPATGATRLPAVSATSVPTLAPSPIPATATPQLVTIFSDPLTGNANGWPVQKGCSFGSTGYDVDGGSQCLAPVTAGDTVNISVQMMNGGLTFGGAGIGFRIPSGQLSQQYSFYIFSTGACLAEDQSSHTTFFDNQSCAVVNQGAHATNTLAINQNGAQMDFYVNGSLVGTGDDATLSGGGIALEAHSIGAPVVFTNFVLTSWQ